MNEEKSELFELLKKPISKCIYSFMLPFLLMLWIFSALGINFDSDKTVLVFDLNNQYVSFLSYLRNMFHNGNDFFYTFSKTLGGDMAGLSAYYLLSPLNILLFFFPADKITNAIYLITLLKIGLCGLSFYYFIGKKNEYKLSSLIFSTSYALMSYNLIYQTNIMWLDGIVMLPIVLLGIENILDNRSGILYIISLFLSIFSCYYIGYMICIFSVLYMLYSLIIREKVFPFNTLKKIGKYIAFSILAGGLTAFVWIPAFKSLSGGKAAFDFTGLNMNKNFSFPIIFSKLYTGSSNMPDDDVVGIPNIFCGVLMLVLFVLYFFNKKIKLKEKIASGALILILALSFYINALNLVWHGFNAPAGFPYRYSFLFGFVTVYLAYRCFRNIKDGFSVTSLVIVNFMFLGITVFILSKSIEYLNIILVIIDVVLFTVLSVMLYKYTKSEKTMLIATIMLISFVNIYTNGFYILNQFSYSGKDVLNYVDSLEPIISDIKETDDSFYRIEKTFYYSNNDAMLLSYNGLSHFSSSEKAFVKDFLGKLGYRNNGTWAYYNYGSTIAADGLLGVKYVLSKENPNKYYIETNDKNNIIISENPYALPLGFMAGSDIMSVDMNQKNLFELQNNIYNSITDSTTNIFIPQNDVKIKTVNITETKNGDNTVYTKSSSDKVAYIEYTMNASSEDPLYVHFPTETLYQTEILLNDKSLGNYFDTYRYDIVSLGNFNIGDSINFKIKLNSDMTEFSDAFFYYQNMDTLQNYYAKITANQFVINTYNSSYFDGYADVDSKYEYMLFTIPYEGNWKIKVDDNNVTPEIVFDTLMAIKIPNGYHSIELKYTPDGFYFGVLISLCSLVILILIYCVKRKNKN